MTLPAAYRTGCRMLRQKPLLDPSMVLVLSAAALLPVCLVVVMVGSQERGR